MREHGRPGPRNLRHSRRVSVAPLHVRHQPCGKRSVRAGHTRRPHPRRDDGCARRAGSTGARSQPMSSTIEQIASQEYKYGFITDIEADQAPPGLNEDIIRLISAKKEEPEWMLDFRLKAYRHWLTMKEPRQWPNITFPQVDYQDMIYYSAPKQKASLASLDEVDPELLKTFEKLGIPLSEQKQLANV